MEPEVELSEGMRREGERRGEENESRYKAMKKSSLRAQKTNKTVYRRIVSRAGVAVLISHTLLV